MTTQTTSIFAASTLHLSSYHFLVRLKGTSDTCDKVDAVLKKADRDRLCLLDELLKLDDEVDVLDPISVNVAAATAQTLQTMVYRSF